VPLGHLELTGALSEGRLTLPPPRSSLQGFTPMNLKHDEGADPCRCRVCRKTRRIVIEYLVRMGPREMVAFVRASRRLGLQIRLDNEDAGSVA
jgi:hypothetical protein